MQVAQVSGGAFAPSAKIGCSLPNYESELQGLNTNKKIEKLITFFEEVASNGKRDGVIRILTCYGRVLYEEKAERESALKANSTALMLLVKMDSDQVFFSKVCSSRLCDCVSDLYFVEKTLREMSPHQMQQKVSSLLPEEQLLAARILRYMEHSYQNVSLYQKMPREDNDLFEQTVGMAGAILQKLLENTKIGDPFRKEIEDELFELEYNTFHYLHTRKNPGDAPGVCKILKGLKDSYSHDPHKQSRLLNLLSCFIPATQTEEVYNNSKQSLQIKGQHPHLFNAFAFALNKSNFVCAALRYQDRTETDDDLLKLQQEAVSYANEQIVQENYHDYFPGIFINQAKLFMHLGKKEEAKQACTRAENVLCKCQDPDEEDVQACALLKQMLFN